MLSACNNEEQSSDKPINSTARPVKIVQLSENSNELKRSYPGILDALQKADLAFKVSGQLEKLPALAGVRVKKGDLLAQIDPNDYKNALAEKQARYNLAKVKQQQATKLLKQKLTSQLNYDQTNTELKSALAVLQQAKDNIRYTYLTAPFDGVIAQVNIENFQPIQAQTPIIHIRSDDKMAIRFSVPESVLSKLKRVEDPRIINNFCGQVSFFNHPQKTFKACHKEHESIADPVTRNYVALFTLDKINEFVVLPGMTASIELDFSKFLANSVDSSIYAPIEAVFSENNKQWLWTVDEKMRAHKLEVILGKIEGGQIQITSHTNSNTKIISAGVSYIRENMLVKPLVKQRGL